MAANPFERPHDPNATAHLNTDFRSPEQRREDDERLAKIMADNRAAQEAALEAAKIKAGVTIPRPMAPIDSIKMEVAMNSDTATVTLHYVVDPYLPSKSVVGCYGRGSTAKSSFVATLAAQISGDYSTLWVSVEEQKDWIKVRHIKAGGDAGTLMVVTAVANKKDSQDRVTGSSFDIYEHLEPSLIQARHHAEQFYNPPRALKLVVLDTAVGLTGWRKGESPNDDASVKRLLAYLQALAERYDVTIVLIGHSNKGKHDHFADTVAGATAWTNSPRLSFVHARDLREEHAYVMRVAKTNLVTFGTTYTTEPIHTLYKRADGPDSVLVKVATGPIVWGDGPSMEMFEEATVKPRDDDDGDSGGGGGHKQTVVQKALLALVEAVYEGGMPVTRDMVHARLGREISRRDWTKVDDRLLMNEFQYQVVIETGTQNRVLYKKAVQ